MARAGIRLLASRFIRFPQLCHPSRDGSPLRLSLPYYLVERHAWYVDSIRQFSKWGGRGEFRRKTGDTPTSCSEHPIPATRNCLDISKRHDNRSFSAPNASAKSSAKPGESLRYSGDLPLTTIPSLTNSTIRSRVFEPLPFLPTISLPPWTWRHSSLDHFLSFLLLGRPRSRRDRFRHSRTHPHRISLPPERAGQHSQPARSLQSLLRRLLDRGT
jgi:hypothetical protein